MSWNPTAHSDQDNLTWGLLRAMEWGRWPLFLSQALAPMLLVFFDWKYVIAETIALNLVWATLVRYQWVSVSLASMGAFMAELGYEPVSSDLRMLRSELNKLTFNSDASDRLIEKARGKYRDKTEAEIYEHVIEKYRKDHSGST